ncbi:amidohydrolase [Rhizobium sp. B230/85]|uniref:M20 aminoacylase family protein n=1 Tax=unclassified Rhizobium TaxID=2613769 RepID=UPI001ADCB0DC|nr:MULTISPECIES: M20 aminoacylase family protein [unclassified Rhizobium]MBO9136465.1 amidohydrolase [Rhizobium sp. B209b/85]QXZ98664.1 amidohydrolase [Rhizobium sp. B230/85]
MRQDFTTWMDQNLPRLIELRQDLHAHPELGFEEARTSKVVADMLRKANIEVTENIGKTGVVGVIQGKLPGQRSIGFRADMDALPIVEATGVPYSSQNPGRMHACGHDGHTTMLMGAALYLAENPDFGGSLNVIFQPAEEGRGGAKTMVAEGLFDRFPCDTIYGMHNLPGMDVGNMGGRVGPMMAAADFWEVTFKGAGGHGGVAPHEATDVTYAQAHFVLALQGIVGRSIAPLETAVISVGYIHGGSDAAPSVIPSEVVIGGTTRSFDPDTRNLIEKRIKELAELHAQAWGCKATFTYKRVASIVDNTKEAFEAASIAAVSTVGEQKFDAEIDRTCGGEDFSLMMEAVPGAFLWIGNGTDADGSVSQLHTLTYNFNDEAIPVGVEYWVNLAFGELGGEQL